MHAPYKDLPPGVVNMVFGVGPRAGEALVTHPKVPLVSFTGSTVVGKRIQAMTAPFIKKLSLEVSLIDDSSFWLRPVVVAFS